MAEAATKLPISKTATPTGSPEARHPFDNLRREIDRVLDTFGVPSLFNRRPAFDLDLSWPREMGWSLSPAVDVAEKDKQYEITAELPGLDEKDVEIKLTNGTLTVKGEKKEEREAREKDYYLSERRYGSFARSFGLPEGIDRDRIEATFTKGVLKITLPKTAETQNNAKTIKVKAA